MSHGQISFRYLAHLYFLDSFFFNRPSTTEIYTLSLHDALPISLTRQETSPSHRAIYRDRAKVVGLQNRFQRKRCRSEEHTSELQSQSNLVCRLLLEKKKNMKCPLAIYL